MAILSWKWFQSNRSNPAVELSYVQNFNLLELTACRANRKSKCFSALTCLLWYLNATSWRVDHEMQHRSKQIEPFPHQLNPVLGSPWGLFALRRTTWVAGYNVVLSRTRDFCRPAEKGLLRIYLHLGFYLGA